MSDTCQITSLVICEDIRREITNKDLIIGAYGGDIVVPSFPAWVSVSMWIELSIPRLKDSSLRLRVSLVGKPPLEIGATLSASDTPTAVWPVVGLQLEVTEESILLVEQFTAGNWSIVKTKKILQGSVSIPFPPLLPAQSNPETES